MLHLSDKRSGILSYYIDSLTPPALCLVIYTDGIRPDLFQQSPRILTFKHGTLN